MISSRTDLFIHSNILQYYSNPHKQHTEKDFYRIFQTKKAEADRSLSSAASAFTYTFLSTFFQKITLFSPTLNNRSLYQLFLNCFLQLFLLY